MFCIVLFVLLGAVLGIDLLIVSWVVVVGLIGVVLLLLLTVVGIGDHSAQFDNVRHSFAVDFRRALYQCR